MKKLVAFCLGCLLLGTGVNGQAAPKKEDLPDLLKALKGHKDAKVRVSAAEDIGHLAQIRVTYAKPAIPVLVDVVKTDKDANVRRAVAVTLGYVNADPKEVMPAFLQILKNDKEANMVLQAVAGTMQEFPGESMKDALPALQAIQKRENDKDEKQRDRNLLQTVGQTIQKIMSNK
jgi:HEAT repeat protein